MQLLISRLFVLITALTSCIISVAQLAAAPAQQLHRVEMSELLRLAKMAV
jgi:hypothetical protein